MHAFESLPEEDGDPYDLIPLQEDPSASPLQAPYQNAAEVGSHRCISASYCVYVLQPVLLKPLFVTAGFSLLQI